MTKAPGMFTVSPGDFFPLLTGEVLLDRAAYWYIKGQQHYWSTTPNPDSLSGHIRDALVFIE